MSRNDGGTDRRRFLKYAGAALTTATAGCGSDDGEPADDDGGEGTPGDEDTPTDTPTDDDGNGDGDGDDASVVITQGQMDSGLDPHDHRETPTDNIVTQAYDGVLDRDAEGRIVDGLANEYERVEDGLVQFTLRDGVTFHNGDELQASDVAFSVNRIVDPEAGDLESEQADQLAGVTGAEATGDGQVEVSSDGLNPIVFNLFASYCDVVQEDWIMDRDDAERNSDMNGTGPFQVVDYEADVRVEFEAYEDHWDGEPAVSELTINAAEEASTRVSRLLADESDIVVNVPPEEIQRVQDDDSAEVEAVPSTRVIFNAMRYDTEPFSSQEFRQAMNYAIDLDAIIDNILAGFADPTGQPTLEGFVGHNPDVEPYPHDPDQAEELVEESGHAGVEIELHTPVGRYLKDLEIAQAVAGYIDDLENVSCSVQQRDFGALVGELVTGDIEDKPEFYLIGWGNTTFDATQTIIPLVTTGGALTTYENDDEVDGLIEQAQSESDEDQREEHLREVNQLLHERAPWVFLNRQYSVYGQSSDVEWDARRDELIDASDITPSGNGS